MPTIFTNSGGDGTKVCPFTSCSCLIQMYFFKIYVTVYKCYFNRCVHFLVCRLSYEEIEGE